jgi:hypothetical protein
LTILLNADPVSTNLDEFLKSKMLNGWSLTWLITVPISCAMLLTMNRADLSSAEAVSSMIQLSVRCSIPWLYLAFAASSLQVVFPSVFSRWLLRNRKFIGLSFAAAMTWQLTFILWLVGIHTEYYVNDVYVLSDVVEGVVGYAFLIAMVLTSFRFGRSRLTLKQWKLLHTGGIYWLWAYAWSVYWFNLFYYETPAVFIDYVYYWGGFLAWGLRISAWRKKRSAISIGRSAIGPTSQLVYATSGLLVVVIGLAASGFGSIWSPLVYAYLFDFKIIEFIDSFMPYFPLVPFYPVFLLALGAFLMAKSRS